MEGARCETEGRDIEAEGRPLKDGRLMDGRGCDEGREAAAGRWFTAGLFPAAGR